MTLHEVVYEVRSAFRSNRCWAIPRLDREKHTTKTVQSLVTKPEEV